MLAEAGIDDGGWQCMADAMLRTHGGVKPMEAGHDDEAGNMLADAML